MLERVEGLDGYSATYALAGPGAAEPEGPTSTAQPAQPPRVIGITLEGEAFEAFIRNERKKAAYIRELEAAPFFDPPPPAGRPISSAEGPRAGRRGVVRLQERCTWA